MSETYTKTLNTEEYLAVYKLGEYFDGSEVARFVASKINERIAEGIRNDSKKEPAFDENKKPVLDEEGKQKIKVTPPERMNIVFTRAELDGFFIGVKESVAKSEVKAGDIQIIKGVCKSLGMSRRFESYSDGILSKISKNTDPLDEEIITEPLD
jgi:hypothetical protein